jgi:hypothetical protein
VLLPSTEFAIHSLAKITLYVVLIIISGVLHHSVINIPQDAILSTSGDVVYIERVSLNAIFN